MSNERKIIVIIPVCMAGGVLAGRPLVKVLALPVFEHVRRRACLAVPTDCVYIATADKEVKEALEPSNGQVIVSPKQLSRRLDLVLEAVKQIDLAPKDIILTVLDNETVFLPEVFNRLIEAMEQDEQVECANLLSVISIDKEMDDQNVIKTVIDLNGNIMCYSRSPLPFRRARHFAVLHRKTSFVAFTKDFFMKFMTLPQSPMEITEAIDFMRILEHGHKIKGIVYNRNMVSVSQKKDIVQAENVMRKEFDHSLVYQAILKM